MRRCHPGGPVRLRVATLGLDDLVDESCTLVAGGAPQPHALAASLALLDELTVADLPRVLVFRPHEALDAVEALNTGRADLAVPWGQPLAPALERSARPRLQSRASAALLDQVQGQASLGWWSWDLASDEVTCSEQLHGLRGCEEGFVPSVQGYLDSVHPDDRARVAETLRDTVAACGSSTFEERVLTQDKQLRHLRSWASVETDAEGQARALHGVCMDVTETVWARRSLAANEQRYRRIFDNLSEGYLMTSLDSGEILRTNRAAEQILGFEPGTLVGHTTEQLWPTPEDRRDMVRALQEGCGELIGHIVRWRHRDGRVLSLEGNLKVFGPILEGTFRDVTERVQREALQRNRYRAVFHQSPLHLQVLTPQGVIVDVNQRLLQDRGLRREDLVGQVFWELPDLRSVPGLGERTRWVIDQAVSTRTPSRSEIDLPSGTGTRVLLSHITPVLGVDEDVVGVLVASLELTEDRKAHAELQRQTDELLAGYAISRHIVASLEPEPILAGILEHLPSVMDGRQMALELDGVRVGPAFQATTTLTGQTSAHAFTVHLDGPPLRLSQRQLTQDVIRRVDQWMRHHDARQGLVLAFEASQAATQAKSVFLANMSHEIRTPLHALLGFAKLLGSDPDLSDEQRESVLVIRDNGQRLLDLLENVLTLSRLESAGASVERHRVDVVELLSDIVALFQPRARERGLTLALRSDLDRLPALLDGDKVRQILTNLVANALRHTRSGEVLVCLDARPGQLEIEVADTGPGIDPSMHEVLFQPFERGPGGATGLGLAISRRLTASMGGELMLASSGPEGSCFRLVLPFTAEAGSTAVTADRAGPRGPTRHEPLPVPAELRALLIEATRQGDIAELERLAASIAGPRRSALGELVERYDLEGLVTLLSAGAYTEGGQDEPPR
jgi:PAS domain S-box-containing protein